MSAYAFILIEAKEERDSYEMLIFFASSVRRWESLDAFASPIFLSFSIFEAPSPLKG
jgi:hypothetical protein